ncbi:PEPxxWA-CTERM sorting domain-containing protein [Sphingosinicellaceae bacterium]|nr:PEPxxWA-CTERM sorting domain-containing protein [Sphingosinicellaceae bacterium]
MLANSAGGNGYVGLGPSPYQVTLYGSNNGVARNIVTFTNLATTPRLFVVNYRYHTDDTGGAAFDRAGVFINDILYEFSPVESDPGFTSYGSFTYAIAAGDSYGLYINSTDGGNGGATLSLGGVPEPTTWALLIAGFGMVGVTMRRRNAALAA